uniref:Ecotropic viral integration site 5 like n=2 Tax=Meleagris gallopavo TaxID=9103 RepID=A0A803XYV3_MELGA
ELIAVKLREAEALMGLKELRQQVKDLEEHWQRHLARTTGRWKDPPRKNTVNELQDELMTVRLREAETQAELKETKQRMMEMETQSQINNNHLRRAELEVTSLQEKVQYLTAQNKGLLAQLNEAKRRQAEIECKSKEEVMAVRLREADRIAAVAELQQHIAELEIQKEEGKIQGQLNKSDSNQYIRELEDQIAELHHEVSGKILPDIFYLYDEQELACHASANVYGHLEHGLSSMSSPLLKHHSLSHCSHIHYLASVNVQQALMNFTGCWFFFHMEELNDSPLSHLQTLFCQSALLLLSVAQQNVIEYWREGSTSTALSPTCACDVVDQHNGRHYFWSRLCIIDTSN